MNKNLKKIFEKSLLFKDSIYGMYGSYFFRGELKELNQMLESILIDSQFHYDKNNLLDPLILKKNSITSEKGLLEKASGKDLVETSTEEVSNLDHFKVQNNYNSWLKEIIWEKNEYLDDSEDWKGWKEEEEDLTDFEFYGEIEDWDDERYWENNSGGLNILDGLQHIFDVTQFIPEIIIERVNTMGKWEQLDVYMSLFYKKICYHVDPRLGAICNIATLTFDLFETKNYCKPNFKEKIEDLYLDGRIKTALYRADTLYFFILEKRRNLPIPHQLFFYLFNRFISLTSEREKIKEKMLGLLTRNPWILKNTAVKECLKESFINKVYSLTKTGNLSERQTLIKKLSPDGFYELFFFFLRLFFSKVSISEYESAFEENTVDQFIDKLRSLEIK